MTVSPLTYLSRSGVAVWLDDLSRPLVRTGGLARLVTETGVVGDARRASVAKGRACLDACADALAGLLRDMGRVG